MKEKNCKDCLNKSPAARLLTDEELDYMTLNRVEVNFKKGDIIFKQDSYSTNVVYLKSGLVKIHMQGPYREKILRLVMAPSYLGIPTTFGDKINNYSATAIDTTTVCFIDANEFKKIIHSNGKFAYEIIIELCRNELIDDLRCVNQSQKQIPGRIAETLLNLSQGIYNKNIFNLPLSRNELGDLVGTSRESISRILTELCNEGIINIKAKEIHILKPELLEKISKKG
jgi:CRP-like cAMP-binding protein